MSWWLAAESQQQVLVELGLWAQLAPAEQAALLATIAAAREAPVGVA